MAMIFAVVVAVLHQASLAGIALGLACVIFMASNPPVRQALNRLMVVNTFVLFLWLIVPWTMPGELWLALGPIKISRPGIELAWLVTLKSNAIFLVFLALVASMDSPTIGHVLGRLGFPAKLVFLFLFTYRYVHVLAQEWQRLLVAARLRGFIPRTNMHTYRTLGNLLAMVFVNSYDRSTRVYQAMRLRGFSGQFVSVRHFQANHADLLTLVLWISLVLVILIMDLFREFMRV